MIKQLTEPSNDFAPVSAPSTESDITLALKLAAREKAAEAQELAAAKAQELKAFAAVKLQQAKLRAEYDTRNHPGRNLMVAFAIGFGLGLIYRK
ncbi:hypothetical protein JIN85_02365 [Luteolibacter pohnpeiensis]|uniref:DUF883 domain-containing protein n=1 Tax=Luteolibacter pohnpeiensis TaxID=454153 RepID=A0A934VV71_9BACT|nr:hypothetical protein [Luteolibacter pohnpeiensis]MBK1881239.1 hypothetical protein [Luteolibacter pohnpeiensis]